MTSDKKSAFFVEMFFASSTLTLDRKIIKNGYYMSSSMSGQKDEPNPTL